MDPRQKVKGREKDQERDGEMVLNEHWIIGAQAYQK